MKVWTIGFTKKPAARFFDLLARAGAKRIVDVRLGNASQLSGFAKRDDLAFFLSTICDMDYVHMPDLAPTPDLLADYRKGGSTGLPTRVASSRSWQSDGLRRQPPGNWLPMAVCFAARTSRITAIGASSPNT